MTGKYCHLLVAYGPREGQKIAGVLFKGQLIACVSSCPFLPQF